MKRCFALLTTIGLLLCALPAEVYAATGEPAQVSGEPSSTEASESGDDPGQATVPGGIVITRHEAVIQGKRIPYTAETGFMNLESGGVACEMFYTAYTRDDAADPRERPITFAFNGGPGASNIYIHFGCLGPRRPQMDDAGQISEFPAGITDNGNSILDMTDLVFIDPVGTGYSRAMDESEAEAFYGYWNDIRSVGDFIRQYINSHGRWASKKYIAGESYGTMRAVGLCDYLSAQYSMYINGLMLISSVQNFSAVIETTGNDLPYALNIPTYAADAWFHGKLSEGDQKRKLDEYLEEVRSFVEEEYVPALFLGKKLKEQDKEAIARKLADYIGLSADYVLKENLRISIWGFCSELKRDERLMIGRYDGRVEGPVTSGSPVTGENDPSGVSADLALVSPYMEYLTQELGFKTDRPYIPLSTEAYMAWPFSDEDGLISQEEMVYDCMSRNPYLKVWVLCGYYDLATPFYGVEWVFNHVFLNEDREKNLRFTYYPSGHMIYMDKASFDKFRKDAEKWYQ